MNLETLNIRIAQRDHQLAKRAKQAGMNRYYLEGSKKQKKLKRKAENKRAWIDAKESD